MKKPRDHSHSKRVDLYPQVRECPECQQLLQERYHKQRWVVQLTGELQVIGHCLQCPNPNCRLREAVYRPQQEDLLALPGYTFGLDVVAQIGKLRYQEHKSLGQIQQMGAGTSGNFD